MCPASQTPCATTKAIAATKKTVPHRTKRRIGSLELYLPSRTRASKAKTKRAKSSAEAASRAAETSERSDSHEEQRGKPQDLRVAVDLPVRDRDVSSGRDPQQVDHPGRRAESERQEKRPENEVRREGRCRRGRCGLTGSRGGVGERRRANISQEVLEWQTMHRGEPCQRLLGPFFTPAIPETVPCEDRDGGRKSPPRFPHRHRGRDEILRLRHAVRGLEVLQNLGHRNRLRRAGLLERMLAAAAGVQTVRRQNRPDIRESRKQVFDGKLRIKSGLGIHASEDRRETDPPSMIWVINGGIKKAGGSFSCLPPADSRIATTTTLKLEIIPLSS